MSGNKNKPVIDAGLCRCCGATKKCRLLNVEYEWQGKREVYSEMFVDCFGLMLSHLEVEQMDRLICATCVTRLREACSFRHQVLVCEQKLLQSKIQVHEDSTSSDVKVEVVVKPENDDSHMYSDDERDLEPLSDNESQIKNELLTERQQDGVDVENTLNKTVPDVEHLKAKRDMLAKLKKMKDKLKVIQKKDKTNNLTQQPLVTSNKFTDKEFNTYHNTLTIIENSYVCPFFTIFSDYHCIYCRELFTEPDKLIDHTMTHDPRDYKDVAIEKKIPLIDITRVDCRLCAARIDDIETLKIHITTVHNKVIYDEIDTEFLKFRLKPGKVSCVECGNTFSFFHALKRHMAEHFGSHICDVCGAHYFDQHGLSNHMKTHAQKPEETYVCKHCSKNFKSKHGLYYHMTHRHSTVPSYPCYKCDEVLFSYYKRYKHMMDVHGEHRSFPCENCDKVYNNRKTLREHNKKNHLRILKHECTVCDKKFYLPSALKDHMMSHTGERNYRCEYCAKTYPRLRALKVHLQSHENAKRYKCALCNNAYTQANNLKTHMRTKHQGFEVKDDD
ncbi:PR domain zinc finger protein 5-like [Achroia grisella]|uniref:PR domain zinc finger protein 5-like n=1 Tax=Achroia grisella TaxID=688607 RepID=UPI0027D2C83A|nr:PR domain zinc finger protein 5-like [Achroia grisella]